MNIALTSLWLPIVLSAVGVFVVSSIIWMVIQYHSSDWKKLANEDEIRVSLKGLATGQYSIPHAADNKARQSEEWQAKYAEGPAMLMVVFPNNSTAMGKQLLQWIIYCLVISVLVAYVASIALMPGADYLKVFQLVGTVATLAYAGAAATGSIWFGFTWGKSLKDIIDGTVYGLLTAGVFGWLWP